MAGRSIQLIGCRVRVKPECIEGMVVDETKYSIVVEDSKQRKRRVLKQNHSFEIEYENEYGKEKQIVSGNETQQRPEERL